MPVSPEGTPSEKPSARMIRSLTDYGLRLRRARSVRAARVVAGLRSASRLSWPVVIRRAVSMRPSAFWCEHGSGNRWARSTAVTPTGVGGALRDSRRFHRRVTRWSGARERRHGRSRRGGFPLPRANRTRGRLRSWGKSGRSRRRRPGRRGKTGSPNSSVSKNRILTDERVVRIISEQFSARSLAARQRAKVRAAV